MGLIPCQTNDYNIVICCLSFKLNSNKCDMSTSLVVCYFSELLLYKSNPGSDLVQRRHHQQVNFGYLSLWPPYTKFVDTLQKENFIRKITKKKPHKKWLKNKHFTIKNQKTHVLTHWGPLFLHLGFPIKTKNTNFVEDQQIKL